MCFLKGLCTYLEFILTSEAYASAMSSDDFMIDLTATNSNFEIIATTLKADTPKLLFAGSVGMNRNPQLEQYDLCTVVAGHRSIQITCSGVAYSSITSAAPCVTAWAIPFAACEADASFIAGAETAIVKLPQDR